MPVGQPVGFGDIIGVGHFLRIVPIAAELAHDRDIEIAVQPEMNDVHAVPGIGLGQALRQRPQAELADGIERVGT